MSTELRCAKRAADGSRCKAPPNLVNPSTNLCPAHSPGAAERLREAGRRGGAAQARKIKPTGLEEDELPPLDSPQAAERWLEAVGRAVATGRLSQGAGRTVVSSVRAWLKAHESGHVSERLEKLMDALASWRKTGDPEPVLKLVDGGGK